MKWILAIAFAALAVFIFFESGSAIKCFECNSFHQQDCADWFNNQTQNLVQCADGVEMCRKIVQEVYYEGDWNVRYIRQCAPHGVVGDDEGRDCTDRTGTYRVKMRYCHCDNQDGCNGVGNTVFSFSVISLSLMLSVAVKNIL